MPDEYEKALTHVAYEYAALESACALAQTATKTPSLIAAIDSFLVHYRSLVEFFTDTATKERYKKDDMRAEDYVNGWKTPPLPEWNKWKPHMHILLAHLSTKRNDVMNGFDHRVHFKPMLDEIRAAWGAFASGLTGTIYNGKLDPLLKQRREDFTLVC
jgi:hypothetical protein